MRVTFFGDTHGNSDWEEPLRNAIKYSDKIVFLGDYVDSFHVSNKEQHDNLLKLINYKKKYSDKIILLLGNHDVAYIHEFEGISGYNKLKSIDFRDIFRKNFDLFDIAWGYENSDNQYTLATHAGLTNNFLHRCLIEYNKDITSKKEVVNRTEIANFLNEYVKNKKDLLWEVGRHRGGVSRAPSIIWCDINELFNDRYENINQIFGHTPSFAPIIKKEIDNYQHSLILCLDVYLNKSTFFSTLYL
ncbi:MAG: metallophosphoesterase [bacterium]